MEVKDKHLQENLNRVLSSNVNNQDNNTTAQLICNIHNELGECILYDNELNNLVWTDIFGYKFYKLSLDPSNPTLQCTPLHKKLCSFSLIQNKKGSYLCAWEDGFQIYDLEKNTPIGDYSTGPEINPSKHPLGRLNSRRYNNQGNRFICTRYRVNANRLDTHINVFSV